MVNFVEDRIAGDSPPRLGPLGNPFYVRIESPDLRGREGKVRISGTPTGGCVTICGVLDFRYDRFHTSVTMF